ncbi:MAG: patatin-like phospholipase family protein [Acetanaerobacterium sp.]
MIDIKRAIVLSGGGARGSYEVGVWKALNELGIHFDIVTGTSVGALNGAMMAQGDIDAAYELWEKIDTACILELEVTQQTDTVEGMLEALNSLAKEAFRSRGVSSAPLAGLLREQIDEDRVRTSALRFGLVTFEVPSMKPHELFIDEIPQGMLVDYLVASASCFPAMHSYEIAGKMFVDGAYYDNLPIRLAVRGGATEAVAVDLGAPGIIHRSHLKAIKADLIEPRWDLGAMLLFDGSRAKRNITLGYQDCMKHYDRYDGAKYTFHKGEEHKNALQIYSLFQAFFMRMGVDIDAKAPAGLPEGLDTVHEYLAKYAVIRTVKKRLNKQAVKSVDVVTAAAEAAGEILELSPIEIYSFEKFNLRVVNHVVRLSRLPYSELELDVGFALSIKESIASITKVVSPIAVHNRMMYILSYLSDYEKLADNKRVISLLASAMPTEFMAALYIIALGSIIQLSR